MAGVDNLISCYSFPFCGRELAANCRCLTGKDKSDNKSIKSEGLCKNEDEDHNDEQLGLLSGSTDTGISDNADADTGGEAREAV